MVYSSKLLCTVTVNLPRIAGQSMVLIGTRSRSVKRAAVLTLLNYAAKEPAGFKGSQ